MRKMTVVAVMALTAAAAPASALSVQNPSDLFNGNSLVNRTTQYTGVVGLVTLSNDGAANACSGALISNRTVLTAAHCVTGDGTGVKSVRVYMPDFNQPRPPSVVAIRETIAPGYQGSPLEGSDLAVVKLANSVARGTQIYRLDTGSVASDLGVEAMVGLGDLGTGAMGDSGFQDGAKRIGYNQYEFTFDDVLAAAGLATPANDPLNAAGAPKGSQLVYDFDDGTAAHDVFGRYLGAPGLGYVSADGMYHDTLATEGDSGAPHFENGKIVGITSGSISGALFEGSCGLAGSVDPSQNALGNCTNGSFGEIGVDTRVAAFQSFITSQIPEPSSWALMIVGFGMIGLVARQQRFIAYVYDR